MGDIRRNGLKVSKIHIENFRHLHNVVVEPPADGGLVCLTGENGSGKTTILKVISSALVSLGLASGGENFTSTALGETQSARVWFDFSDEDFLNNELMNSSFLEQFPKILSRWNGLVEVKIQQTFKEGMLEERNAFKIPESGFTDVESSQIQQRLMTWFDEHSQLKHLTLDSNRAYIPDLTGRWDRNSIAELETIFGRKAAAALGATDQYHQWLLYAHETNTRTLTDARERGRLSGNGENGILQGYSDPFESLNAIVVRILPHLRIIGTDLNTRQLRVESGGHIIDFSSLSGGEREILFLSGQIDRLKLTKGILMIDEPELHLHPDMIRRLISVVREISGEAQIWIATHSFEAVESAGYGRVFIVSRGLDGISRVDPLSAGTLVSALTAALGTPGLSLIGKTFVIVEGGDRLLERRRFERLCGQDSRLRFVQEGKTSKEVLRSQKSYENLASETDEQLIVKAVVDGDFDSLIHVENNGNGNILKLSVHEVENLFIDPVSLTTATRRFIAPKAMFDAQEKILEYSDDIAGRWIWNLTQHCHNSRWREENLLDLVKALRETWSQLSWIQLLENQKRLIGEAAAVNGNLELELMKSIDVYTSRRIEEDWWKHCFGKEIFRRIGGDLGFKESDSLENTICTTWEERDCLRPLPLLELRRFLNADDHEE